MNCVTVVSIIAGLLTCSLCQAQDQLWMRQIGTVEHDRARGVAADSAGNAYICGDSNASLGGPSSGGKDAFLAKYNASGAMLWIRLFGTPESEYGMGVAVNGAGEAYICGSTTGDLGGTNAGDFDAFLAKYSASGVLLWMRQVGTNSTTDCQGVAVDTAGNAYIVGIVSGNLGGPSPGGFDAFLVKYDPSGTLLWKRQIGSSTYDYGQAVAVDTAGSAYITGFTAGNLGGPNAGGEDVFVAKYDAAGTLMWTRQFGTSLNDNGFAVAVDGAGNASVTGYTEGKLGGAHAGGRDVFLAKYDTSGTLLFMRQFGTAGVEMGLGVTVNSAGTTSITGATTGSLGGPAAGTDVFLATHDISGTPLLTLQFGSPAGDIGYGVAVSGAGSTYIAGYTEGALGGPNAGRRDVFLTRYGDACYADCDQSTGFGVLDVFDFLCFQNAFVTADPYACDCDTSTGVGVCDVFDFLCFQDAFVGGCP